MQKKAYEVMCYTHALAAANVFYWLGHMLALTTDTEGGGRYLNKIINK